MKDKKIAKLNEIARSFEQNYIKELKEMLREPMQFYKMLWKLYNLHFESKHGHPTPLDDIWGNDDFAPYLFRGLLSHIIHGHGIPQWAEESITVPVTEIIREMFWVSEVMLDVLEEFVDERQHQKLWEQLKRYEEMFETLHLQGTLRFADLYELLDVN